MAGDIPKNICIVICAVLVITTLVAYEPIRHNGFVNYDDEKYVTENPNVKAGLTLNSATWAFTKSYISNWHPLTWLSHMLDCQFFGLNPFGHHLVGLFLHITNALLIFWILTNLTGSIWASAFIAAVFSLHPLQVESVAWAAERKTVLSGLFWFLTMAVYIWYAKRPGIARYISLFAIYGLCIMTKPVVVTLPLVLLLLDYWPLNRLNSKISIRNSVIEKIPLLALSVFLSVMTFKAQQSGGSVIALDTVPLNYRIANVFVSYIKYIGKLIFPDRLAVIYPYQHVNFSNSTVLVCTLLFALLTALAFYIGRRRRYAATGWLWFAGTLVPMIGLVQVGTQSMADRYMYLSMAGLLIIIAFAMKDLIANRARLKILAAISAAILLLSMIILSRIQVTYWHNSMTLFEHTIKVTGDNATAENNYGLALVRENKLDEAVPHLEKAIQLSPNSPNPLNILGEVFAKQGKFDKAIECLNEAVRICSDKGELYSNLGTAYMKTGKSDLAIQNFNKALELEPDNTAALNNLAWVLVIKDNVSAQDANKAIGFAENACKITGNKDPALLDTLAGCYAAAGRFDEALKTANEALNLAKAENRKELVDEIQGHLTLYQAGQPYRKK